MLWSQSKAHDVAIADAKVGRHGVTLYSRWPRGPQRPCDGPHQYRCIARHDGEDLMECWHCGHQFLTTTPEDDQP